MARHLENGGVDHKQDQFRTGSATIAMLVNELAGIPYSLLLHRRADLVQAFRWRLDEKIGRAKAVTRAVTR